jgi:DNA repair exonuclease SbcCD ATPase subunit
VINVGRCTSCEKPSDGYVTVRSESSLRSIRFEPRCVGCGGTSSKLLDLPPIGADILIGLPVASLWLRGWAGQVAPNSERRRWYDAIIASVDAAYRRIEELEEATSEMASAGTHLQEEVDMERQRNQPLRDRIKEMQDKVDKVTAQLKRLVSVREFENKHAANLFCMYTVMRKRYETLNKNVVGLAVMWRSSGPVLEKVADALMLAQAEALSSAPHPDTSRDDHGMNEIDRLRATIKATGILASLGQCPSCLAERTNGEQHNEDCPLVN